MGMKEERLQNSKRDTEKRSESVVYQWLLILVYKRGRTDTDAAPACTHTHSNTYSHKHTPTFTQEQVDFVHILPSNRLPEGKPEYHVP